MRKGVASLVVETSQVAASLHLQCYYRGYPEDHTGRVAGADRANIARRDWLSNWLGPHR
jgi:hypothetical protein